MAATEFIVVDVGAEGAKIGASLVVLAVGATLDEARAKAAEIQPRSSFVAILERKLFLQRKPRIDLQELDGPIVPVQPPATKKE